MYCSNIIDITVVENVYCNHNFPITIRVYKQVYKIIILLIEQSYLATKEFIKNGSQVLQIMEKQT